MNFPSYNITGWRTFLLFVAVIITCVIINVWFFRLVPWFEVLVGVMQVIFFFIVVVSLWVMAPRNPPSFLLKESILSGWDNYFISWNIGILSQVWLYVGKFISISHPSSDKLDF